MRTIFCLTAFLVATIVSSAPLPNTRPKEKKKDPAEFLIGQWDMKWSVWDGTVTFHEKGKLTGYWPALGVKEWAGKWEYKNRVIYVHEYAVTDEGEEDSYKRGILWHSQFIQQNEDAFEGDLLFKDELHPVSSKVRITRVSKKF